MGIWTELGVGSGVGPVWSLPDGSDFCAVGRTALIEEEGPEEMHFSPNSSRVPACRANVKPRQVTRSIREAWELVDCPFCRKVLDDRDAEVAAWLDGWRQAWKERHDPS